MKGIQGAQVGWFHGAGTLEDCDNIVDTLWQLSNDRSVHAAILTGKGRAFCSGGNIKGIKERKGIGPLNARPATLNPNWGGVIEPNTFGTHEFLDFVDQIGSGKLDANPEAVASLRIRYDSPATSAPANTPAADPQAHGAN